MKTIARNFSPLGGISAQNLSALPGRAESARKTEDLRWSHQIRRIDFPCLHGNVQYLDFSVADAIIARLGFAHTPIVPMIQILWTGGKCACNRTVSNNPYLRFDHEDDYDMQRYHEKGRCGSCSEHCGGFGEDPEHKTLEQWLEIAGLSLDDLAPAQHPLFAIA